MSGERPRAGRWPAAAAAPGARSSAHVFRCLAAFAAACTLLCGCAVGPDYVAPDAPDVATYAAARAPAAPLPAADGGEPPQRLVAAHAIPADWWRLFHCPALDELLRAAVAGSPSLDAARAKLAQAQQAAAAARGSYLPQVDFAASAQRQKGPAFALGLLPSARQGLPVFNLYALGPIVSYSPDVFGLTARRVERQDALAENQPYELAAAHLVLSGNAVTQALTIASLRRQAAAIEAIVADDRRNVALVREKFGAGRAPRSDVLTAETQLANDRALLPPLDRQRTAAEDALAVAVGKFPAQWTAPAFDLADFSLPPNLPVSLPSTLVRQRPDILAAEAQLHASSAAVGVATAQMYPSFSLSASVDTAACPCRCSSDPALVWTLAGGLSAPIFHGGALASPEAGGGRRLSAPRSPLPADGAPGLRPGCRHPARARPR